VTLRTGHGKGAGTPRIEVLPADELPVGTPVEARPERSSDRGQVGRFAPGNSVASKGGRAKAGKVRLGSRLGLDDQAAEDFAQYKRAAVSFRRAQCAALAASVGNGACGPGPSSLVATAALQLAWSRYFSDKAALTGDAKLAGAASKLGNDSRQNLLAAHELCAREGKARPKTSPHAALMAALEGDGEETTEKGTP
jgi:hypothetical protein